MRKRKADPSAPYEDMAGSGDLGIMRGRDGINTLRSQVLTRAGAKSCFFFFAKYS
jgi:hypothetical protein